jgi:hypothetical protein
MAIPSDVKADANEAPAQSDAVKVRVPQDLAGARGP